MSTYTTKQLNDIYAGVCGSAIATCRLTREMVGGQPAGEDGVRAFALHHLKIPEGPELEAAIKRILGEEIGERDVAAPEGGELKEKESYGLNVIRRDEYGPWIGDWMLKAGLKQAASRLGLFVAKRGTKGDVAEMGKVSAHGISLHGPEHLIHLIDAREDVPAKTFYQTFKGRVRTPQGDKSIVSDAECAPAGSRFSFRFQWYDGKLTEADIVKVFAVIGVVGVGSAKSLERGKFDVETLVIE